MVFTEYCGAVYTNYIGSTQALELLKLGTDNLHEARRLSAETKVLRFITPGLVEGDDANHRQGGDKITDGEVGELWYSMCLELLSYHIFFFLLSIHLDGMVSLSPAVKLYIIYIN